VEYGILLTVGAGLVLWMFQNKLREFGFCASQLRFPFTARLSMGLFRRPSISRMLGISAAKAKLSRQLGFSITKAAKGIFAPTKPSRRRPFSGKSPATVPRRSAVVVGKPSDPDAIVVRISARDVAFPLICPCCMGPADASLYVGFSRPNGEWKRWQVPHCNACFEYERLVPLVADARAELEETEEAAELYVKSLHTEAENIVSQLRYERELLKNWRPPTLPASLVAVIAGGVVLSLAGLWLSLWMFAGVLFLTWLLTIPILLRWPQIIHWFEQRHAAQVQANAEELIAEETAAPTVLAEANAEALDQIEEAAMQYHELKLSLQAMTRPGRVELGRVAVEYLGWDGTIHMFAFAHPGFAAAFGAANAGKIIS
jgi:hypothetical protein